jgi:trimeric autotransporter adhesin
VALQQNILTGLDKEKLHMKENLAEEVKKGLSLGKGAAAGGAGILGMLGGALGGVGSLLGSVVGGITNVAGSILGGIGSLLGGAASGIFGILGSALGGMGFMGILAAGAIGFVLYQIYKSLDFSKLGNGLGDAFSGIKESLSNIFGKVDGATDGKLGKFVDDVKDAFIKVTIRVSAAIETATELLMKLGGAVLKDFGGYFKNFFEENKGKIYALMAIGIMGPRALLTLPGAAITAIAAAVGAATSEKSTQQLKEELFNTDTEILKNKEKR